MRPDEIRRMVESSGGKLPDNIHLNDALVGIVNRFSKPLSPAYDLTIALASLMHSGLSEEHALYYMEDLTESDDLADSPPQFITYFSPGRYVDRDMSICEDMEEDIPSRHMDFDINTVKLEKEMRALDLKLQ